MVDDRRAVSGRMEGHGFYTEHSQAQADFGSSAFDWLEQAAAEIAPPAEGLPFVIADFGAAGGGNSVEPMRRALAARTGSGPAVVVHTDIPGNDFSSLFTFVQSSPATYVDAPDIFTLAAGRSFYERLFPDRFLSLGWSSIAVHWLSERTAAIGDHIYSPFARGEVRAAFVRQSAHDWRVFLDHRAHELRSSGRLIVLGGANTDDGVSGAEGLMDAANDSLRAMVDGGALRESEYRRMTIPTWNRTLAEFVSPFDEDDVAATLDLRRAELRALSDPYYVGYQSNHDLDAYVDAVVAAFRSAFEESLWSSLDPDRDWPARDLLRGEFASQLSGRVAADPHGCATTWHVALLDIAAR